MKKKLIEGVFGIPMKEEVARAVEALMKTLPKECRKYRKTVALPHVELVSGERADISTISTDSLDRDGEVVFPSGIDTKHFMKNPAVYFAHRTDELPVGRAQWIKLVGQDLKSKTVYANRPKEWEGSWFPDAVWAMVQQEILKGKSIGFLATKIRSPTSEEIGNRPEWKNCNAIIENCLLLEYSVAPLPANQDALVDAVAKGICDKSFLPRFGIDLEKVKAQKKERIVKGYQIDPERIARKVIQNILNRGRA